MSAALSLRDWRDAGSARRYDVDGRLQVNSSHLTAARVCGYRGSEIPDGDKLGLDPSRIYELLRAPSELVKAANTFSHLPILSRHMPITADTHRPELVIGCTGQATWRAPYIDAPLIIWTSSAIASIESGVMEELSAGYRYVADMTPGVFNGVGYEGIMRSITGQHVALVESGRTGSDCRVAD